MLRYSDFQLASLQTCGRPCASQPGVNDNDDDYDDDDDDDGDRDDDGEDGDEGKITLSPET